MCYLCSIWQNCTRTPNFYFCFFFPVIMANITCLKISLLFLEIGGYNNSGLSYLNDMICACYPLPCIILL